jgi:hypothetical protein
MRAVLCLLLCNCAYLLFSSQALEMFANSSVYL